MTRRLIGDAAFAAARCLHTAFFLATSLYAALTYSTFTYRQFIAPREIDWIFQFADWHHAAYWEVFCVTILTLASRLTSGRGRSLAWIYLIAGVAAGVWLTLRPPLSALASSPASLWVAAAAIVPILWLAAIDHLGSRGQWPAQSAAGGSTAARRRLYACLATALYTGAVYASIAATRGQTPGIRLTASDVFVAGTWACLLQLLAFSAVFQLLLIGTVLGSSGDGALSPRRDYAMAAGAATVAIGGAIQAFMWPSLSFPAAPAWGLSAAWALALVVTWSSIARRSVTPDGPEDGFSVLFGSLSDARVAVAGLVLLPWVAFGLSSAVASFDWDFVLQKFSVVGVWFLAFGCIYALIPAPRAASRALAPWRFAAPAVLILVVYAAALGAQRGPLTTMSSRGVLDQYTAISPAFRLMDDVLRERRNEPAFYDELRANTNIPPTVHVDPVDIEMARLPGSATADKPHIFLFVIDSLRRDYLSPYNSAVTFTPAIARFAAESLVFRNAFTRYGGTALAVPSIWSGSLLLHKEYVTPFRPMNALRKLLDAEGYERVMSMDSIMSVLDPRAPGLTEIDGGVPNVQFDLCRSLDQLQPVLDRAGGPRPIFAYSLPQNVHIINVQSPYGPSGRRYPGFYDRAAVRVERMDACFGRFIESLKARGLYDRSVIVITSDHGDSLGEEGRWGHGVNLFPEVVRIPLIMHVPSAVLRRSTADLDRVSFSTDITPTLYALLGHPSSLGDPTYGESLLASPEIGVSDRRRAAFVLASSYGPTYGALTRNGRQLYIVDAIAGRDYLYDLSSGANDRRRQLTDSTRQSFHDIIRAQIAELARIYHFHPNG